MGRIKSDAVRERGSTMGVTKFVSPGANVVSKKRLMTIWTETNWM